tara:strand:- start:4862 stop:7105 length:2244 start_codon:yes stop_codon:yes gene_type:complete
MPYEDNNTKPAHSERDFVNETIDIYQRYSKKRDTWAVEAKEDREFRLGKQWTTKQVETLEARGQAAIVVNRIHPAVETAKAMITANRPSFRASPREDSDKKVANVMSNLLSYMYDISDGVTVVRKVVDDYYVMGIGYMQVYQDPMMDMGKGEVCIHDLDPLDVYVDPNSQHRFFDDAENIIVSRLFTKEQAKKLYPMFKKDIEETNSEQDWNAPETGRHFDGTVHFPEDVGTLDNTNYVRGYERYYKKHIPEFRVFEQWSGKEDVLNEEKFEKYSQRPAWIIEGQIITDKNQAAQLIQLLEEQNKTEQMGHRLAIEKEMEKEGLDALAESPNPPQREVNVLEVSYKDLIEQGAIEVVKVLMSRVHQCVVVGDKLLYKRILPIEQYPIVPFMNIHTRSPYPVGDVRLVKGMQEYINKTRSLIIAHATTSTNTKILVPEGSVDMADFEQKWAQPGVAISYDPTDGAPMAVQPSPLPNELYQNEMSAKNDIDHQLGIYEMMQGNTAAAPQTYKATISLDEFGQRKIKSKLADIEAGLTRVAQVAIPLMQQLYTTKKVFRVVNPNNSLSEYVLNQRLVDDKTGEIEIFNDITVGKYDVVCVAGSTLPTNRYAELEFYKDAFQMGLIDRQEVLKKTEVFDAEGVQQRMDTIAKLQGALQGAQEEIKKLKGDLQTRDRESVNLRKKLEVEKFASGLDKVQNKSQAASTLYEKRLDDTLSTVKRQITDYVSELDKQEKDSPSSGKKQSKNRRRK